MNDGNLNLRLLGGEGGPSSYDVVARIEAMDPGSPPLDFVVPSTAVDGVDVRLDVGTYSVQLFMPSGRVLQQGLEVEPGSNVPLTFHEPGNGAAGFSLQEASGSASLAQMLGDAVRDRPELAVAPATAVTTEDVRRTSKAGSGRRVAVRNPVGTGRKSRAASIGAGGGVGRQQQAGARVGRAGGMIVPELARERRAPRRAARPAEASPTLRLTSAHAFEGLGSWRELAVGPPGWGPEQHDWVKERADEERSDAAIWRLDPGVAGHYADGGRRWCVVQTAKGAEVISLPAPWRRSDGALSPIDVLVDARIGGRAGSSVAINDATLDGLLSYLDRGRLSALRPLVSALEQSGIIERTIHDKMANPLAACAAAYVGLAVHDPAESERWDSWLPNIMSRFGWLPDGAIVHARRIMLRPQTSDEGAKAMAALERAHAAGIPYYSSGLMLMREMLEILRADHPLAVELLRDVTPIAARCDPRQTFTVLRFPEARP